MEYVKKEREKEGISACLYREGGERTGQGCWLMGDGWYDTGNGQCIGM